MSVNVSNHALTSDSVRQVTLSIRVVFLKIGEIDTMKENFMADAFIQARWEEPAFDGQMALVRTHSLTYLPVLLCVPKLYTKQYKQDNALHRSATLCTNCFVQNTIERKINKAIETGDEIQREAHKKEETLQK